MKISFLHAVCAVLGGVAWKLASTALSFSGNVGDVGESLAPPEPSGDSWNFVAVADLDLGSRDPQQFLWNSYLQQGVVKMSMSSKNKFIISFDDGLSTLASTTATKNRSMEISTLELFETKYDGSPAQRHLHGVCDYTGFLYDIDVGGETALIRHVIRTGHGRKSKPFKCEWSAVKDDTLYLGSIGTPWVHNGKVTHEDCMWVKTMSKQNKLHNVLWKDAYIGLMAALNISFPGYVHHEAVVFDAQHREWIFAPRKVSAEPYDEKNDERNGANVLLIASEDFGHVRVVDVGPQEAEWGFTALKALPPGAQDGGPTKLIALKVREIAGELSRTKIGIFDTEGVFYMDSHFVELSNDKKFEGLAVLPFGHQWPTD